MALAQQRQIDANIAELDDRQRLIAAGQSAEVVAQQLRNFRSQIVRDEQELSRLSSIQRQSRALAHHHQTQRRELGALENLYAQEEGNLRQAVEKVEGLKKQVIFFFKSFDFFKRIFERLNSIGYFLDFFKSIVDRHRHRPNNYYYYSNKKLNINKKQRKNNL